MDGNDLHRALGQICLDRFPKGWFVINEEDGVTLPPRRVLSPITPMQPRSDTNRALIIFGGDWGDVQPISQWVSSAFAAGYACIPDCIFPIGCIFRAYHSPGAEIVG
jgi:hypothetical protein